MNLVVKYQGPFARALEKIGVLKPVPKPASKVNYYHSDEYAALGAVEVIDLPRICAVHERPYSSRYVRKVSGIYIYSQPIKVTQFLWEGQYDGNEEIRKIPPDQLGQEICAWCGAHGHGSVICYKCRKEVCYGRCEGKTDGKIGRCGPSCGGWGPITTDWPREVYGYVLKTKPGGNGQAVIRKK
jgi:hypothetical protein